jgi:MFS family permease
MLSPLHEFSDQPDFLRLLGIRILSGIAQNMLVVVLAWQMYNLTGSAWDLGLVGLLQFAPVLALTLPAGHLADRYSRTRILSICTAVLAITVAALLVATVTGAMGRTSILLASVVLGSVRAFQMPAQQSLLGALLPTALLPRGAALAGMTMQAAVIGGPALAGFLFLETGLAAYAVCLVMLVVAFVLGIAMQSGQTGVSQGRMTLESLLAGFRFVQRSPILLGAVSLDLMAVLLGGATALLPIFAKDILHVGSEGLGALRAAPGVGALIVSVWMAQRPLQRQVGPWLFASVAVFGLATLGFGLSTDFWLSMAMLAITGAADMVSVVIRQTLMQLDTPDEIRGRVGAVNSIFIGASNQLGEFESGAVAAAIGPVGSVVTGAIGTLVVVVAWIRLFPALAWRDRYTHPNT